MLQTLNIRKIPEEALLPLVQVLWIPSGATVAGTFALQLLLHPASSVRRPTCAGLQRALSAPGAGPAADALLQGLAKWVHTREATAPQVADVDPASVDPFTQVGGPLYVFTI